MVLEVATFADVFACVGLDKNVPAVLLLIPALEASLMPVAAEPTAEPPEEPCDRAKEELIVDDPCPEEPPMSCAVLPVTVEEDAMTVACPEGAIAPDVPPATMLPLVAAISVAEPDAETWPLLPCVA